MTLQSIDPSTGETFASYDETPPDAVRRMIGDAAEVRRDWEQVPVAQRADRLRVLASSLESLRDEAAVLMAREMGKPLAQGRAELDKCALLCRWYAEHGPALLADESVSTEALRSYVAWRPLGVVLAVMPWNFPWWQVLRFAVPALLVGNAGLLKHASNVCGSALAIERAIHAAGFPLELFRTLLLPAPRVEEVLDHDQVAAVTLTGSTPAGRAVASRAGALLKKTVLELGGSDPYLVLADADLDRAARACATSRLINSGQSCIAAKRFLVERDVAAAFEQKLARQLTAARMGAPLDPDTDVGPLARRDLRDELHGQVRASVDAGARLVLGGEVPGGPGAYYPPTLLADVPPDAPARREELFGPVGAIIPVDDVDEAVTVANETEFGLGAAVFTRDVALGEHLARERLHAGSVFVNDFVRSDPRLPFGGVGASGYGRELAALGLREFTNAKAVWVARDD